VSPRTAAEALETRMRYGPLRRMTHAPTGARRARFAAVASSVLCLVACLLVGLAAHARPLPTPTGFEPSPRSSETLDRATPRRTLEGFLREANEGHLRVAAGYLDLHSIAASSRDDDGPDLARKLAFVLDRQPTLDISKAPDDPEGDPDAKPAGTFVADTLYAGEEPVPIALKRVRFPDGVDRWLISEKTVELIPTLDAAYGPRPIGIQLPSWLTRRTLLGNELWQWLGLLAGLFPVYGIARALAAVLVSSAVSFKHRLPTRIDDAIVASTRRPLRMVIWALLYRALVDWLQLTSAIVVACEHVTYTALVFGLAWLLLRALGVWTLLLDERATRESYDAFAGRRMRTQAVLLRRVASIAVVFLAGSIVLMQFDVVRSVGVSLLASAGVVGVVVGFAAQKSLAGIIGGIQFSVAQPVRVTDQVVVEGEFGEIEEINLTYVVVRLWDQRRLILPITYFLEKPFQNWTRTGTELIGQVSIKVDVSMPIDAVRAELKRVCEADPLWDKRTCALQATDSDTVSVTLRALVSARDASTLWDLRCNVRERLLAFVHTYENGKHIARVRHEVEISSP
jgi:small-conductance mechanosensitive channel